MLDSFSSTTYQEVEYFGEVLSEELRSASSFEAAARSLAVALQSRYPSIVLARVFATIPVEKLPPAERDFAKSAASDVALFSKAEVLTLFASAGVRPEWNDRRQSRAHLAIPLVNRQSIENAPMISRLLRDLRYTLDGEESTHEKFVTRAFANANGLCYIPDAVTSKDEQQRLIIPAQDFVRDNAVRSVFAFGGSFVLQRMFVATIVFTTETVSHSTAMHFVQLSSAFKAATTSLVRRNALFEQDFEVGAKRG